MKPLVRVACAMERRYAQGRFKHQSFPQVSVFHLAEVQAHYEYLTEHDAMMEKLDALKK